MFAYQYITRPGNGYGGYVVNDCTNTVFIRATSESDTLLLREWLGKGDRARGRAILDSEGISLPTVSLNPAQYNAMVSPMCTHEQRAYTKGH